MIALAGMIGTGLFLSSGKALAQAGPLGCVAGFIVVSCFTLIPWAWLRKIDKDGDCHCFDR